MIRGSPGGSACLEEKEICRFDAIRGYTVDPIACEGCGPIPVCSTDRSESCILGKPIDYLTFVPDGEPTLDGNLGEEIELLRTLGTKVAVISNASLACRPDVVIGNNT